MADDDTYFNESLRDRKFWLTHCWKNRFNDTACAKPATWMGPPDNPYALSRLWRACDEHRVGGDLPYDAKKAVTQ